MIVTKTLHPQYIFFQAISQKIKRTLTFMWENYFYTPWFSLLTYLLGLFGADVFFWSRKVMPRIYKSKYVHIRYFKSYVVKCWAFLNVWSKINLDLWISFKLNFMTFAFSIQSVKYGILLPKLFWPTVRKKCSSDLEFFFEIRCWRSRICKMFEITRTIYSNIERSEQFLVTECFFNLFLQVSHF